jgi:hypothetical protein
MDYYSEEEVAARELRRAAYHEVGHKVMCEHFGGTGCAVVWRNRSGNLEESAWQGQFRPRISPEAQHRAWSANGLHVPALPPNWKELVGMAGLLAEELLIGETDDAEVVAFNMYVTIKHGAASATDLEAMGIADVANFDLSCDVVEQGMRILREAWSRVQSEAESIIADAIARDHLISTVGPCL